MADKDGNDYKVQQLGYVAFGVPDLQVAADFYSRVVRLTVSERQGSTVFMTGGRDHHWLRLQDDAPAGLQRIGFKMVDEDALDDVRQRLTDRGIPFERDAATLARDRVDNSLRFTDPTGVQIELYTEMAQLAVDPVNTGVNIEKFLHAVWSAPVLGEAHSFYQELLGFRTSDWMERATVFMRCADRYHHGIGLTSSAGNVSAFDHFCILVESIDDVMRYRHNGVKLQVPVRKDVLRHGPSESVSVYLTDPLLGHAIEYATGHPQVDDALYTPRVLPISASSVDIWKRPLPDITAEMPPSG